MVEVGPGGQEKGGPPSMTVTEEEKEGSKVGSNSNHINNTYGTRVPFKPFCNKNHTGFLPELAPVTIPNLQLKLTPSTQREEKF
jgi:hypothetical protein